MTSEMMQVAIAPMLDAASPSGFNHPKTAEVMPLLAPIPQSLIW